MLRRILDSWITYAVGAIAMIASGISTYNQFVDYENGESIIMSGRLFWLYNHTGKAGIIALDAALVLLFIWGAWFKYKTAREAKPQQ